MKMLVITAITMLLSLHLCVAQDVAQPEPTGEPTVETLQQQIAVAEANVNELVARLRARTSESATLENADADTKRLREETRRLFDLQTKLHLRELSDAEAKIAASRRLLNERSERADEIVGQRIKSLLEVSEPFSSPQAVVDAWEQCMADDDYDRCVSLLSDDGADLMAGMMLQSMTMMGWSLSLIEAIGQQSDTDDELVKIKSVIETCNQFMRPTPVPEAAAALAKLASIMPSAFVQLGATGSDGAPVTQPTFSPGEYTRLLRLSAGMVTDSRAFAVACMKAASAIDDNEETKTKIASKWEIVINGVRATATQQATPIDQTVCKTASIELILENGRWKISQMASDDDMLAAMSGAGLSFSSTTDSPQASPTPSLVAPTNDFPAVGPPVDASVDAPAMPMYSYQGAAVPSLNRQRWKVDLFNQAGEEMSLTENPMEVIIDEDQIMRIVSGSQEVMGPTLLRFQKPLSEADDFFETEFINDPNGKAESSYGLLQCNESTLRICIANDTEFRPQVFLPGKNVSLLECSPANTGKNSKLLGKWKTSLHQAGGEVQIGNGRLIDPDRDLAALEETIPREELLAGPWILEIEENLMCLRHATARIPFITLDIANITEDGFDVTLSKQVVDNSPLAAFIPDGKKLQLRGRYSIEGNSLKLSISDVSETNNLQPPLSPNADLYFECERYDEPMSKVEPKEEKLPEWNDFLELLPEVGTVLVMFGNDSDISKQMEPVARSVAEAASIKLIELPQIEWRRITTPPATHFVLMKDRQLVGTRTGLLTEKRLAEFVGLAKDWLTPHSTGVDPASLVRIDCFISPGTDNIGSQHGGAYPLTTVVVAVHEDQALLLGPDSIAEYMDKGYACVAIVRDEAGNSKQVPLDVVQVGPVKLVGQENRKPKSAASATVTLGEGTKHEIPIKVNYPKSITEPLDAYDTGSAVYLIRGAHGLSTVKLAPVDDLPEVQKAVLSGGFTRDRQRHPLFNFTSPIDWQSQTVASVDSSGYGGNLNGPELIDVLCPTRPTPCGFTFNSRGQLIGKYALGHPTEDDMTHTIFQPDTTHSILRAALMKIEDAELKSALEQTLEAKYEPAVIEPAVSIRNSMEHIINPAVDEGITQMQTSVTGVLSESVDPIDPRVKGTEGK